MKERKGIPEREGTETESPKMARQGEKKEDSGRLERGHERGQSWRMVKDLEPGGKGPYGPSFGPREQSQQKSKKI